MKFNEYSKKNYKYDGERIIKVGARELYSFVYKRKWDLTQYDMDQLKRYGLEKAIYIYIGSSEKLNLRKRNRDWKYDIVRDTTHVAKVTKEFINKLKKFYEEETDFTTKEINESLYHNSEIIARCESKLDALKIEKSKNGYYHGLDLLGEIMETRIILLSKRDSNLREIKDGAISILKLKN